MKKFVITIILVNGWLAKSYIDHDNISFLSLIFEKIIFKIILNNKQIIDKKYST